MIGILGGTFDPIHFGHLRTTLEVAETLELEQVRFIPCAEPPHRQQPHASAAQRLAMVQAAIADEARFVADDREIQRSGPSYMVDTLSSLREDFASRPLGLILGMDAFITLERWHQWPRLLELAHLFVMIRPDGSGSAVGSAELQALVREHEVDDPALCHKKAAGSIVFCSVTQLAISSTNIRALLQQGRDIRYLLPESVYKLISNQKIY